MSEVRSKVREATEDCSLRKLEARRRKWDRFHTVTLFAFAFGLPLVWGLVAFGKIPDYLGLLSIPTAVFLAAAIPAEGKIVERYGDLIRERYKYQHDSN